VGVLFIISACSMCLPFVSCFPLAAKRAVVIGTMQLSYVSD